MNALHLADSNVEISNFDSYIEKSLEISTNIHNYRNLETLEEERKLRKMVFPEGFRGGNKNSPPFPMRSPLQ